MVIDFRQAKKLVAKHGSPILVISEGRVKSNYQTLKKIMGDVTVHYPLKTAGHKGILNILRRLDSHFDVASYGEIQSLLDLGIDATRMLYSNPVRSIPDTVKAYNVGVERFVYDNDASLNILSRYAPESDVMLRVSVSNDHAYYKLSTKFGAQPKDAIRLLKKAKKLGLNPDGIAFNAGSHSHSADDYINAIALSKNIFKNAKKEGIELEALDIGGGFPCRNSDRPLPKSTEDILWDVKESLDEHFPKSSGVELIVEPGRFTVSDAGVLLTRILGKSKRHKVIWYYLDDGAAHDLADVKFSNWDFTFAVGRRGKKIRSVLAGPTCDSFDVITRNQWLPELELGDIIMVRNAGAYTSGLASTYNGFQPAETVYIP
ncbi:type III PLP-dependent enzyme [Candidatus Micrarchaeota archaeon]|nr:type III PLP-dependent enzyme [Candidatus Micrarchaeota archaeon]